MHQKGPDERFRSVCHPSKCETTEDRRKSLDLGLSIVHQGEWDSLQPQRVMPKCTRVSKQNPSAEEKFPADQIKECRPGQAIHIRLIVSFHGFIAAPKKVDDRSHQQNTNGSDQ